MRKGADEDLGKLPQLKQEKTELLPDWLRPVVIQVIAITTAVLINQTIQVLRLEPRLTETEKDISRLVVSQDDLVQRLSTIETEGLTRVSEVQIDLAYIRGWIENQSKASEKIK